jgi:hypothetical protein
LINLVHQFFSNYNYMLIIIIIIIFCVIFFLYDRKENFAIKPSSIQGVGLYAEQEYNSDIKLFKAIEENKKITHLGSKINHCNKPNTYLKKEEDGWYVYSRKKINFGEELLIDYNDTPNFIKKPNPEWKC